MAVLGKKYQIMVLYRWSSIICGFFICRFNQPPMENIKKSYIVTDVYYAVRPTLVVSVEQVDFFSSYYSLNNTV